MIYKDLIYKKILKYVRSDYINVINPSIEAEDFINNVSSEKQMMRQFSYLTNVVKEINKSKILDYGCGWGSFVNYLNDKCICADGYEIDKRLSDIANDINDEHESQIFHTINGLIPVNDELYDVVFSYFVLEHVSDLENYIKEGLRILKKGGYFIIISCNYSIGYEFHYSMWLPLFSKGLSKILLQLNNRDPDFLDTLSFINPTKLRRLFKNIRDQDINFDIMNLGRTDFINNVFDKGLHSGVFIKTMKVIKFFGLLNLILALGLYNPVIYVLRKSC